MGLRVSRNSSGEVQITMPPGGENPLGRIRFNFFNRFLVYQHDTPDQYLFAHDVRAESHGCMRVANAAKYAEVLSRIARADGEWTAEKVKSLFGPTEVEIQLQSVPVWVHLTYQTAFVDEAGRLQTRRDLYNLDGRTLTGIKSARSAGSPERKYEPEVAMPAPATAPKAPAHRRKLARRAHQIAAYQSTFSGGVRYMRPRPPRGIIYR
jgi:murein L,D-transpeptidase YcbB/YkuD